ncbi:phage tail length tape measure family protein [Rhizobium sp. BK060]|uniref:phage tail length tape measure family protein n=1 Tax=Rhizobium sp. BK060 TaxID=2587096 RepID=UPI001618CD1D|nr:phage tail length tape measure family protein [Rhizobium sp. BK060]MBB3396878.1 GH24 family phage-related lysozyme (muramidase) [Rhizobium sp. BK060]
MAATAEDLARLLVSIEFTQKQSEKQLAAIAKAAERAAKQTEDRFTQANDNVGKSFQNGGKKVEASIGAQRAAISNLSFQLNDIATSLAGGASPFTVMAQQGSQVAQALSSTGGGLGSVVKTIGGAFAQMANPVSLASFALIGLAGAAVQYFSTLKGDVPDAEKLLKAHAELIKSFDEAWGIAKKAVDGYSDSVNKIELQKLRDEFGSLQKAIESAGADLKGQIVSGLRGLSNTGGTAALSDMTNAIQLLNKEVPDFRGLSLEMEKIEGMKGIPENIRELAKQLRLSANESLPLQEAVEGTQKRLKDVYLTGEQAKATFAALTASALGLGNQGGGAISSIAGKIRSELIPAMEQALSQVGEYAKNLTTLQDQINKSPLGTLSPLYSGGGRFMNSMEASNFDFNEAQLDEVGKSAAAKLIRSFEGFITNAKWDVNAFRVGFGSDTATRANGVIEKVTKDTVVTLDEAQRDLSRRILEFQDGIQNAIGIETWKSLSEGQKAALTSIAYNYGSLPDAIVKAIQDGGGPAKVAQAIANLTANPSRRKEEAQNYLSGTGISLSDAGIVSSNKKTPSELFQGDVAEIQKRIDVMNAAYAAQARLNPLVNDYGYAVEKAKIQQQLLSEAQKAGLAVTPELAASIDALAENYAKASSASEVMKTSQERLRKSAEEFRDLGRDVVGGFISDLREGKSATEALANALDKVTEKLIDMALNAAFDGLFGGNSGGGFLSGLLSGGSSFNASTASPGLWSDGGYTGNGGKYEPAGIVHKGEYVMDAESTKRIGVSNLRRLQGYANGGLVGAPSLPALGGKRPAGGGVVVNIQNNSSAQIKQQSKQTAGGTQIDVLVDEMVADKMSTPGSRSRGAMQSQFGLKGGLARR